MPRRPELRYLIPAVVAVVLLILLAVGLSRDPREVPSPLIGKPAPAFALKTLDGKAVSEKDFAGKPVLVNFWASWCGGCQVEHPVLLELARQGVPIVGMDYKDTAADGSAWLAQRGNPYRQIIQDPAGSAGLDWGVYGVPETFVLDAQGVIRYKQIGPMTMEAWEQHVRPLLTDAR